MKGSCHCRTVTYEAARIERPMSHCHCVTCRKTHSAAYVTTARVQEFAEPALDTAEPATHLVELYSRRGYVRVDTAQREGKRYRSVVMAKKLHDKPGRGL